MKHIPLLLTMMLSAVVASAQVPIGLGETAKKLPALMVSSTDHRTAVTGATLTCKRAKNLADASTLAGSVAEVQATNHPGLYALTLAAGDVDTAGALNFTCTATGADPAFPFAWVGGSTVAANGIDPKTAYKSRGVLGTASSTSAILAEQIAAVNALAHNTSLFVIDGSAAGQTVCITANTNANPSTVTLASALVATATGANYDLLSTPNCDLVTGGDPWSTVLPGAYGATTAGAALYNSKFLKEAQVNDAEVVIFNAAVNTTGSAVKSTSIIMPPNIKPTRLILDADWTSAADATLDVSVESSFDNVNWNTVGTFAQVVNADSYQEIKLTGDVHRFLRTSRTVAGTNPVYTTVKVKIVGAGHGAGL